MNLTILPPTLHFLQLPKSQLWTAMPAITSMLLRQGQQKGLFLNYTETLDEVSFLMDAKSFSALLSLLPATLTGWSVSPGSFRAISVSEGESANMTSFNVTTGLVASLSAILAENQVSIFYVSTFETDFVVIKQSQVARAIQILKEKFGDESVEVEEEQEQDDDDEDQGQDGAGFDGEGEPGEGEVEGQPSPSSAAGSTSAAAAPTLDPNASVYLPCPTLSSHAASIAASVASVNTSLSASSSSSTLSQLGLKSLQVSSPLQLYELPQTFYLAHWREEEVCTHIRSLLQLFFFPLGKSASAAASSSSSASSKAASAFPSDRFFSYSNIDAAVSMQVDAASLALLQADHRHLSMSFEKWRAFQVAGQFGFEECGIVAALSGPLTRASICPYYISSFFTDVCFVQEAKWEHARTILEQEFKFVDREIRPKAQAAAAPPTAAASSHTDMHTSGTMHTPLPHPTLQPPVFHGSTLTGAYPAGAAQSSLALMRGISNTSNSTGGHSISSPAHTRGPSNLHSPAPVDNYAPMGSSDVSMPILSAGGVSHTPSYSSNRGSSPSPYDAMGSGDAVGGMSRPLSMPTRTSSTGSATADPSPYDPIGPTGAVSGGGASVPLLMTHTSSYSTAMAEPSPYDAVHSAPTHAPAQHAAPQPHAVAAAAAPSPYAAIGSTDINSSPMHMVPHAAVAVAPAAVSPVVTAAAVPPAAAAKPAGAFSLFASAALVMPSSPAPSAAAAAAPASVSPSADSGSSHATPFTADALSAPVERLSCFRVSVDKAQSIQLLRLGESAAPSPAAAAASASLYSGDSSSPAAAASSSLPPSDGLFLLRPCSDPSELLASGLPNPNLWVLCYNKKGAMVKTKVYRITTAGAATAQWSLGLSGHRLFPSLHAIITAVVGPHAKPIA